MERGLIVRTAEALGRDGYERPVTEL